MGKRFGGLNSISTSPASGKKLLFLPQAPCVAFQSLQVTWGAQTFLCLSTCQWPKFFPPLPPSFPQLTWSKSCLQTWPIPWSSFQKQCSCKMVQLLSADKAQSILQSFDDTVCQLRMWKKKSTPYLTWLHWQNYRIFCWLTSWLSGKWGNKPSRKTSLCHMLHLQYGPLLSWLHQRKLVIQVWDTQVL